jgi:hypothetical protein
LTAANANKASSEEMLQSELKNYFSLISQVISFRLEKSLTTKEFSELVKLEEFKVKALESGDYLPTSLELASIKQVLA